MKDKTNGKLYKIKDLIINGKANPLEKINQIISIYNTNESNIFTEKLIRKDLQSKYAFKFKLYTLVSDLKKQPDWIFFLNAITEDSNDELLSINSSFLLFLYNSKHIYVLSRGYYGFAAVSQFVENDFGLNVISCLLKQNLTSIKGLTERKFFGEEFLTQRNFKGEFVLSYDDNFGKIYNEIIAEISEDDFEKLGIQKKKKNFSNASINVSNSIEVTSSFNIVELIKRIEKINQLLITTNTKNKISLNHFTRINHSKLISIKSKLEDKVIETCYESLKSTNNKVDFFFKDLKKYLNATKLSIIVEDGELLFETESIKSMSFLNVFENFKDQLSLDSFEDFKKSIELLNLILELNNDPENIVESNIYDWINAEIQYEEKNYFKIDGEWYTFEKNLDQYLDNQIKNIDFSNNSKHMLNSWKKSSFKGKMGYYEGDFNSKHSKEENFIVADKCFYKNIELADLIKIEKNNIFLIHVKRGIDRDLRVLSSQVLNAARTLRYNLNDQLLGEYYLKIKTNQYKTNDIVIIKDKKRVTISFADFKNLFNSENNKINFVFAISSDKNEELKKQLNKSKSRIAKLAFIHTTKEIKKYEYDLYFELIKEV